MSLATARIGADGAVGGLVQTAQALALRASTKDVKDKAVAKGLSGRRFHGVPPTTASKP